MITFTPPALYENDHHLFFCMHCFHRLFDWDGCPCLWVNVCVIWCSTGGKKIRLLYVKQMGSISTSSAVGARFSNGMRSCVWLLVCVSMEWAWIVLCVGIFTCQFILYCACVHTHTFSCHVRTEPTGLKVVEIVNKCTEWLKWKLSTHVLSGLLLLQASHFLTGAEPLWTSACCRRCRTACAVWAIWRRCCMCCSTSPHPSRTKVSCCWGQELSSLGELVLHLALGTLQQLSALSKTHCGWWWTLLTTTCMTGLICHVSNLLGMPLVHACCWSR